MNRLERYLQAVGEHLPGSGLHRKGSGPVRLLPAWQQRAGCGRIGRAQPRRFGKADHPAVILQDKVQHGPQKRRIRRTRAQPAAPRR